MRRVPWAPWIVASCSLLTAASLAQAQGFVEHLEPPAVARGKTTRVTAIGTGLEQAFDLWTSLPKGALQATLVGPPTSSAAVFDVRVAPEAPVGVNGLRLATTDGLGNAVLFLVEDLPLRPATSEPAVTLPAALWGRFRAATVDRFSIEVQAGQTVSFEAVGNRLGKDVDPLLTIRDAKGRIVAERDNDPGLYFDFRFEHTFAAAGKYVVELREARYHGSAHASYVLRMGRFPTARNSLPVAVSPGGRVELRVPEPVGLDVPAGAAGLFQGNVRRPGDNGSAWLPLLATALPINFAPPPRHPAEPGTPATLPGLLCGTLAEPGARQVFHLALAKGQKIVVKGETRAFNSPADLEITILDARGRELRRAGENDKEVLAFDFTAGEAGLYGLSVRDGQRDGGPAFAYAIDVRTGQPNVQVNAEVEGLCVPRGSYQSVPLTVSRGDYAGPIALTLVGAPPGVTLTPMVIEAAATSMVCKLAATDETPLGLYTLQIAVRPKGAEGPATLVQTRPLIDRQLVNVDLIPHTLREEQRRLPPALADRFAVQITPSAPFTFELPAPLVMLARYQKAEVPIVTTRVPGFTAPLAFSAKGGQLAAKEEGRTRVYAEFPPALPDRLQVTGAIHSRILTNTAKHRVEVTAVGVEKDRKIVLLRTFDLDVRTAFAVTAQPALLKLGPGESGKVRLTVERVKTFDGDVAVQLSPAPGLALPDKVVIPRGQDGIDVEIKTESGATGRQGSNLTATATVDGFEEEQRGGRFEVEIVRPAASRK